MKKNKLLLPVSIILGCFILGGFFYVIQTNKMHLEEKKYLANKEKDCLNIYKTESDKWTNVRGWKYIKKDDECLIIYKDQNPKSAEKCDERYPTDKGFKNFLNNTMCKAGEFGKSY